MTNIFSIVADQKQVVISVNSIWFTGFAIIVYGFILIKFLNWIFGEHNDGKETNSLEAYIKRLEEALYESLALNMNWASNADASDLEYYSEHRRVINKAKEVLKLSKNPEMHNI